MESEENTPVNFQNNEKTNLYEILGVAKNAATEDIRKAFRTKVKGYHPDKGGDSAQYALLQKAYEVLLDPVLREYYDRTGRHEKNIEEDFIEEFRKNIKIANGGEKKEENDVNDFNKKITATTKEKTHTAKFDEWRRSRNLNGSVVDDEYLMKKFGVARCAYETVKHKCTHPTLAIVKKNNVQLNFPSSSSSSSSSTRLRSECMELCRVNLPRELNWGEVLVNMMYAPVNPYVFTMIRLGEDILWSYHAEEDSYGIPKISAMIDNQNAQHVQHKEKEIIGNGGVGVVREVAAGVKQLREGDWILTLYDCLPTWRVAAVWRERDLIHIPTDIVPVECSAVIKELFLAYYLLQHFASDLMAGDAVILNAANSLVGQTIIQLAKLLSLRTIAIIRYENKESFNEVSAYLLELGASKVFSEVDPILNRMQKELLALPKLALDGLGGLIAPAKLINSLQTGGKFVSYGAILEENLQIPWHLVISRDIKIESFYLTKWLQSSTNQAVMIDALYQIGKLLNAKKLIVNLKEHKLEDYKAAVDPERSVDSRIMKDVFHMPSIEEEEIMWKKHVAEMQQMEETVFSGEGGGGKNAKVPDSDNKANLNDGELKLNILQPRCEQHNNYNNNYNNNNITNGMNERSEGTIIFLQHRAELPQEYEIIFKNFVLRDEAMRDMRVVIPHPDKCIMEDNEECLCWCETKINGVLTEDKTSAKNGGGNSLTQQELLALQSLESSCESVARLVEREAKMLKGKKVILCGYDEGGVVALITALTKLDVMIGGVVCFGMPQISQRVLRFLLNKSDNQAKECKIFLLTGSHDTSCPPTACTKTKLSLEKFGVKFASVDIIPNAAHEFAPPQLAHLSSVVSLLK